LNSVTTPQAANATRAGHGGISKKPVRKLERPFSKKDFIHLILKSEKARGSLSFLKRENDIVIREILREKAHKFAVSIHDFAKFRQSPSH
jgi:hypothetical protein